MAQKACKSADFGVNIVCCSTANLACLSTSSPPSSILCSVLYWNTGTAGCSYMQFTSCALCSMSSDSVFNIAPASLTLGAVLARGSPGITLFKADLLLGQRTLQVQLLTVFPVCLLSASFSLAAFASVTTCLPTGGCKEAQHKWGPT